MSHINPDGNLLGVGKVDQGTLAWLHIYGQPCEHFPARIVGNKKALTILKDAIEQAIAMPINGNTELSGYIESANVFATDGEGYEVMVKLLSNNPVKVPMVDNIWERFKVHYDHSQFNKE